VTDRTLLDEITSLLGAGQEARWLLEHLESTLPDDQVADAARALARRRSAGEPLQYLIGLWPFRTIELLVDQRVLIPRPETEHVVGVALDRWRRQGPRREPMTIVDLGTGSGAIGLSLAIELAADFEIAQVILADVSAESLEVAAANADRLGVSSITMAHGSWFDALDPALIGRVDLLVSNPPYVAQSDRASLAPELGFEPSLALFSRDASGVAGFGDVEAIIGSVRPWLAPGGVVVIEMAEHQTSAARVLAESVGLLDAEEFDDLAEKRRGIVGRAPK
jgi:release factor glutamine methyltransferase